MPTVNNPIPAGPLDNTGLVDEATMRKSIWPLNPYYISRPTLRQLIRQHRFPGVRIGGRYFFRLSDVAAFLQTKGVSAEEASAPRRHGNLGNKNAAGPHQPRGKGKAKTFKKPTVPRKEEVHV
jgi:excisionase family DNA binding protein